MFLSSPSSCHGICFGCHKPKRRRSWHCAKCHKALLRSIAKANRKAKAKSA